MAQKSKRESASTSVPAAAIAWVRSVFERVNEHVSATLSRIPTHHESELDMQLIAFLNQVPAVTAVSGWTVYIQTHFLGGRRHFFNWEVADIGLLVILRDRGKVLRIKVGLLQSKRLYPKEIKRLPDHAERVRIGFGSLLESPATFRKLAEGRTFSFSRASTYLALTKDSEQQRALTEYENASGIPIYYLFYNPVVLPWSARVPATKLKPLPSLKVGCRVLPSKLFHSAIARKRSGYHPTYGDTAGVGAPFGGPHKAGWLLQHFVADELLRCREGHIASSDTDQVLETLFYRRSGPIAAAIAITVEAPAGVNFALPEPEVAP